MLLFHLRYKVICSTLVKQVKKRGQLGVGLQVIIQRSVPASVNLWSLCNLSYALWSHLISSVKHGKVDSMIVPWICICMNDLASLLSLVSPNSLHIAQGGIFCIRCKTDLPAQILLWALKFFLSNILYISVSISSHIVFRYYLKCLGRECVFEDWEEIDSVVILSVLISQNQEVSFVTS